MCCVCDDIDRPIMCSYGLAYASGYVWFKGPGYSRYSCDSWLAIERKLSDGKAAAGRLSWLRCIRLTFFAFPLPAISFWDLEQCI